MLPVSRTETTLTTSSRSFQKDTVGVYMSKGYKVIRCQSWRCEKKFCHPARVAPHRCSPDDKIILKVLQTITLQRFDLQRLNVSIWKDLASIVNILLSQKFDHILKICFVLSKWPHFNSGNVRGYLPFFLLLYLAHPSLFFQTENDQILQESR